MFLHPINNIAHISKNGKFDFIYFAFKARFRIIKIAIRIFFTYVYLHDVQR